MASETKLLVTQKPGRRALAGSFLHPLDALRLELNRLIDDFSNWQQPFRSLARLEKGSAQKFATTPAADVAETGNSYEITAELPGMDEKNVAVTLANGGITIKGEKKGTEEKKKDYYISERRYGSFERYFDLPEGVDADKIAATFKNGVLKVILPKTTEAQKPAKQIEVKAA